MMYPKLALEGIRKNKQLYYPYLLTCAGMVFLYFIIGSLSRSPVVNAIPGASTAAILLTIGKGVIAIFAAIFLFYTGSFLTRRRQKEFGLYNILGMSKWNISRILVWETLLVTFVSLIGGIGGGIILYKLAELALIRMLGADAVYEITIVWQIVPETAMVFGCIYLLQFAASLLRVRLNNPIALLHSENAGEKPPRANWLLALLGLGLLAGGYYIAVTMKNPVQAVNMFFPAVGLVILGTYLVFVAVSVVLCRILQKNKKYYYNPRHFVSVSNMVFRMKRNGAGLASICILATMVLVIMSSTICLQVGQEDILRNDFPRDFVTYVGTKEHITEEQEQQLIALLTEGAEPQNEQILRTVEAYGILVDGTYYTNSADYPGLDSGFNDYSTLTILDEKAYETITGEKISLAPDEAILQTTMNLSLTQITIPHMGTFQLRQTDKELLYCLPEQSINILDASVLVIHDYSLCDEFINFKPELDGSGRSFEVYARWDYQFDIGLEADAQIDYEKAVRSQFHSTASQIGEQIGGAHYANFNCRASARQDYFSLYGGIFFLGVLLSAVFLLATVLIIYYKQICEGYEDAARFEIMQKVGMTAEDIRRSINSQIRTVFFLPIALAGVHMIFAFPIIRKLLVMFYMTDVWLFIYSTIGCYLVFTLLYAAVYRITSNSYFKLVSAR